MIASLTAVAAVAALVAPPQPAEDPRSRRDPLIAWTMSALGSTVLIGAGAGQLYAGDPLRGAAVSLGGVAVPFGAAYLVPLLRPGLALDQNPTGLQANVLYAFVGSALIYGSWAAFDASYSARPANGERFHPGTLIPIE